MTHASPAIFSNDRDIPDQPDAFVMQWHPHALAKDTASQVITTLYFCPAGQASSLKGSCSRFDELLELGSRQATMRLNHCEDQGQPYECVIVVKSVWHDGVDDINHSRFMALLQRLASSHCQRISVLTLAAIRCESAYPRVRHPLDAVYLGLAQGFAKETSRLPVALYSLAQFDQSHIDSAITVRPINPNGATLCIGNGACWIATLVKTQLQSRPSPYIEGATYLIIGGRSGIGAELAKYLAKKYKANLILVSRSVASKSLLRELRVLGANPCHEQCDISEPGALARVLERYPLLDGIYHSALNLADTSFENMTPEQLLQSLQPKVHGSYHLLQALRQRSQLPGFVTFFSSIQSYIAYPGQANYTAGCLCTDALADLFESVLSIPTRVINWGYWGSVGVVADDAYRRKMLRLQIGSIEPEHAMPMIADILASDWPQVACLRQSKKSLRLRHIDPDRSIASPEPRKHLMSENKETHAMNHSLDTIAQLLESKTIPHDTLNEQARVLDDYARYRWHQVFRSNEWSIATRHEKQWQALQQIPDAQSLDQEALLKRYPQLRNLVALLEQCLTHYPAVLAERMSALQVLFPRGDASLLKNWYTSMPMTRLLNVHMAEAIISHATTTGNHALRVLEIGAGTGSTPRVILPMIANHVAEYCYSDASEAFKKSAIEEFAAYPFMRYRQIDAANLPDDLRNYDVIIASNVMHAIAPIGNVLQRLAAVLKDDGLLMLNETVFRHDVLTIAFGIIDGWWPSDDLTVSRITDSPLLNEDNWRYALLNNGFNHVIGHGNESAQLIISSKLRPVAARTTPESVNTSTLARSEAIADRLSTIISEVILLDAADLDRQAPLAEYGVDSILAMQILDTVSAEFGPQPADTLEQHASIEALAAHLSDCAQPAPATSQENTVNTNHDAIIHTLKAIIGDVILLEPDDIDHQSSLADYGVDSILALNIIEQFSAVFGPQPADLIEQYPSIVALAQHFASLQVPVQPDADTVPVTPEPETLPDSVSHHQVGGQRIAPGAYALSWMTEASGARQLNNVCWHRPMVRLKDAHLNYANGKFSIVDQRSGHVLCSGEYDLSPPLAQAPVTVALPTAQIMDSASIYRHFEQRGYSYGPLYRGIAMACVGDKQGISVLMTPLNCEKLLPPALIDSGLQTSILLNNAQDATAPMLPTHLSNLRLYGLPAPGESVICKATLITRSEKGARYDFSYSRLTGELLLTLTGMLAVAVSATQLTRQGMQDSTFSQQEHLA